MEIRKITKNFLAFTMCGEITPNEARLGFSNIDFVVDDKPINDKVDMAKNIYFLALNESPTSRRFKIRIRYSRVQNRIIFCQVVWLKKHIGKTTKLSKEIWKGGFPSFRNEEGNDLPVKVSKLLAERLKQFSINLNQKGQFIYDPMEVMEQE